MKYSETNRGFHLLEFEDRYGSKCSLQESSLATEGAIWFGVDTPFPTYTGDGQVRMHITQKQMKKLLPYLKHFAKTGYLPDPRDPASPKLRKNT